MSTEELPRRLLVTRRTAARLLDCSTDHIDDLRRRGVLEAVSDGRVPRIKFSSIENLIDSQDAFVEGEVE